MNATGIFVGRTGRNKPKNRVTHATKKQGQNKKGKTNTHRGYKYL